MTDLFFNELSCEGINEDNLDEVIHKFASVAKEASAWGVQHVRFEKGMRDIVVSYNLSLFQYCCSHSKEDSIKALFALQDVPYLQGEVLEKQFVSYKFLIKKGDVYIEPFGLACALLANSAGIGFYTAGWDNAEYTILVDSQESVIEHPIVCISDESHLNSVAFSDWADRCLPPPHLIKSKQIPSDKHYHIPSHHGMDQLEKLAKKLLKCPYIEEVITSVDRDSFSSSPVDIIDTDQLIIRLVENGGYALIVRTTALNLRQARAIAQIINEHYLD